jgi:hypothetical protein
MKNSINALLLLLSISASAQADDAGIVRCRSIADAAGRLACYDSLVVPLTDARSVASKPVAQPDGRPAPGQVAPISSATPSAAVTSPQLKTDQFGLENRAAPGTLDAIESHIPGRFEGWEAKSTIKLANGQVWQIADDSNRYLTLNDPKVRIRRGALGAFYLEFEKINHSPRVRRIQ